MFSNYNVKKILPRLIIVAIAVNVSYHICAAAVDISNILGANLRDLIAGFSGFDAPLPDIESIVPTIIGSLAAGAAAVATVLIIFLNLGSVFIAVLMVLAVLAFRNIIVTVLIIISPIAFVLYLLPNTEKWFKKWAQEFARVLFVYPAIAFVWGATTLLTNITINAIGNSDSTNWVNHIAEFIMVCLMQLIPVAAIIPIMKMGGQALGKLEGIARSSLGKTPIKDIGDAAGKLAKSKGGELASKGLRSLAGKVTVDSAKYKNAQSNLKAARDAFEKMKNDDSFSVADKQQARSKLAQAEFELKNTRRYSRGAGLLGGALRGSAVATNWMGTVGHGDIQKMLETRDETAHATSDAGIRAVNLKAKLEVDPRQVQAQLKQTEFLLQPKMVANEASMRALKAKTEGPTESSREFQVLTKQLEMAQADLAAGKPGAADAVAAASAARDDFQAKITDAKVAALNNLARTAGDGGAGIDLTSEMNGKGIDHATARELGLDLSGLDAGENLTFQNMGKLTDNTSRGVALSYLREQLSRIGATIDTNGENKEFEKINNLIDNLSASGSFPLGKMSAVAAEAKDKESQIEEKKLLYNQMRGTTPAP